MPLFAGIDGGQTSTVAVVVDEGGAVLGRGTAGPSDHVDEPPTSQRAAQACEAALATALAAARAPAGTELAAVVVGLSGYEGSWHGREPGFGASAVRYVHDSVIALAGAIRERPAAIVIAGTGSAAYGETSHGTSVRAGGFGYLFGDEGSSFAIARTALAAAMRVTDRGVLTDLGAAALAYFDCEDLRGLARAVSLRRISRPQVASFARVVFDAARLGDPEAAAIVADAAAALAGLAQLVVEQLGHADMPAVPLAFVGGAVENPDLRAAAQRRLEAATPLVRVVAAAAEPAVGAALLAFDAARVPPAAGVILERLAGLIVSIQPEAESVLNAPETVALLARCAAANGAAGVRIEGPERIAAVRRAVDVPIVGLLKRSYSGFEPYITPTAADVAAVAAAGAEIVAFDATGRAYPDGSDVAALIGAIHAHGAVAMADCATGAEIRAAAAAGAEIVATTLCGYTAATRGHALPALDVLREAAATGAFAILEGGVADPRQVQEALSAGAGAVVVGTALTNLDARIRAFAPPHLRDRSQCRKIVCPVQSEKVVRTSMENGVRKLERSAVVDGDMLRGCSWHIRSPRPR